MMPGEIVGSPDGPIKCNECGCLLMIQVMRSNAGHYIGTGCDCGPYSRESHYYEHREQAEMEFKDGSYLRRSAYPEW